MISNLHCRITTNLIFIALSLVVIAPATSIASSSEKFTVGSNISDGKKGRPWKQWKQSLNNNPIERITARVRKVSGPADTYINLRFNKGSALDNGKRISLPSGGEIEASWNLHGERPDGRQLVMNAYKGVVTLVSVEIHYRNTSTSTSSNTSASPTETQTSSNDARVDFDPETEQRCLHSRVKRPRIEIGKVKKSGGVFSGKYRVEGSMYGACIEEAGLFVGGRLRKSVDFPFTDKFKRKEFSFQVRSGKRAQLRIYTINGREDVVDIDEEITESGNLF